MVQKTTPRQPDGNASEDLAAARRPNAPQQEDESAQIGLCGGVAAAREGSLQSGRQPLPVGGSVAHAMETACADALPEPLAEASPPQATPGPATGVARELDAAHEHLNRAIVDGVTPRADADDLEDGLDDFSLEAQDALIHAALSDDLEARRAALGALLQRCETFMRFGAFRALGTSRPQMDHDEVYQASCVAFMEALPNYRREAAITSWAVGIAFHQAQRFLSAEVKNRRHLRDERKVREGTYPQGYTRSAESQVGARQMLASLEQVLVPRLTPQEALIFQLLFSEQRSVPMTAKLIQRTETHVRTVRCNIRKKARACLQTIGHNLTELLSHIDKGPPYN